jgi:hypothetical protein
VIVIQVALLVDVQLQPVAAETVTLPVTPPETAVTDAGEMVGEQGAPV